MVVAVTKLNPAAKKEGCQNALTLHYSLLPCSGGVELQLQRRARGCGRDPRRGRHAVCAAVRANHLQSPVHVSRREVCHVPSFKLSSVSDAAADHGSLGRRACFCCLFFLVCPRWPWSALPISSGRASRPSTPWRWWPWRGSAAQTTWPGFCPSASPRTQTGAALSDGGRWGRSQTGPPAAGLTPTNSTKSFVWTQLWCFVKQG